MIIYKGQHLVNFSVNGKRLFLTVSSINLPCCYSHGPSVSAIKYSLITFVVTLVVCCVDWQDVHGVMPGEPESDSEGSSMENLGDVTQFGLTGALAQMANMTFLAGAPGIWVFFQQGSDIVIK